MRCDGDIFLHAAIVGLRINLRASSLSVDLSEKETVGISINLNKKESFCQHGKKSYFKTLQSMLKHKVYWKIDITWDFGTEASRTTWL